MLEPFSEPELDSIEFQTRIAASEDEFSEIEGHLRTIQKTWPRRSYSIIGIERWSEFDVLVHLIISKPRAIGERYVFRVSLECEKFQIQPSSRRPRKSVLNALEIIRKVVDAWGPYTNQAKIDCTVRWIFPSSRFSPIVALPLLRLNLPGATFTQVTGVRLTGEDTESDQYAILDLESEDFFSLSVGFSYNDALSTETVARTAELGGGFRQGIVVRRTLEEDESTNDDINDS